MKANWINAHRRCSRCHTRPVKKEEKQKLFLYKGFSLCQACYNHVIKEGA